MHKIFFSNWVEIFVMLLAIVKNVKFKTFKNRQSLMLITKEYRYKINVFRSTNIWVMGPIDRQHVATVDFHLQDVRFRCVKFCIILIL